MITQVFLRAMVAPGTRTFMCPPRHRAMLLNFLAQGKSLPPAGIELGTFGLQRSRVSHVIHCASKTHCLNCQEYSPEIYQRAYDWAR